MVKMVILILLLCLLLLFLKKLFNKKRYESYQNEKRISVKGTPLQKCNCAPNQKQTGWLRDGYCSNNENDTGTHIVCAKVTNEFLNFTRSKGNDLITPSNGFPGLVEGDCWCLCVSRWLEAYREGVAPPIYLDKTDQSVLKYVDKQILEAHAL